MEKLQIIKIGGHVIDEPELLSAFLKDVAAFKGRKVIVHGGGKIATEMSSRLGLVPKVINGRRVTDLPTMHVVTMVYAGLINKLIVSQLNSMSCKAAGFTGADGNAYPGIKRVAGEIDYGLVADLDPSSVNTSFLHNLIENEICPVLSPVTADFEGNLLNINADTVASTIASALSASYQTELIMCFEKEGIMNDPERSDSLIKSINADDISSLIDKKVITGGMIPKVENARDALKNGVSNVLICNAAAIRNIQSGNSSGTRIYA